MMQTRLIKTQREYRAALRRIEQLMDARRGTPRGDELELLAALIEIYEEKHAPVPPPEPVEAIRRRAARSLQQRCELFPGHFAVGEYFVQQARPDLFAGMNRHNGGPTVRVPQKVVAASDANDLKADLPKDGEHLFAARSRKSAHISTNIRCTPTN